MNERPLVTFTLLTQMAVGAFLAIVAIDLGAAGHANQASTEAMCNTALLVIVPLAFAGLLSSLLHLGAPRNAWRALANVRSSWLSREVLLALVFCGLAGLSAVLAWIPFATPSVRSAMALTAGLTGVALVYAMARVYRLRTVAGWDTALTTVSFFATTVLLGSLLVATLIALMPGVPEVVASVPLRRTAFAAAASFAVEIAVEERGNPSDLRRVLMLAGLGLCGVQALSGGRVAPAVVIAFGMAVATQVIGRYRFYVAGLSRIL